MARRVRQSLSALAIAGACLSVAACKTATTTGPSGNTGVTGVSISASSNSVAVGTTLQLSATVAPSSASQTVTWSSSDLARATVSQTGLVTALLPGSVTITATSAADPTKSATVSLTLTGCVPLDGPTVANGATLTQGVCYQVTTALTVSGGTLTVPAGVRIEFGTSGDLTIATGGRLNAVGTAASPITFTSIDPAGRWRGIRFMSSRGAANSLQYVTLENGGSAGWTGGTQSTSALFLDGNSLVDIQQTTIANSGGQGITLDADAEMTFVGNTLRDNAVAAWVHPNTVHFIGGGTSFVGNTANVVRVTFGNTDAVTTDQTWLALEVPYEIQDRTFVRAQLTIEPGAVLASRTDVSLIVENGGALSAIGTALAPITFTSAENLPNYWQGLKIATASTGNQFDYVHFENGGSKAWTGATDSRSMVYLEGNSKAVFTHTMFSGSGHYGLWVPSGGDIAGFDQNTFVANARAMIVHPTRAGAISANNTIAGNTEDLVRVTFGNTDAVTTAQAWHDFDAPFYVTDRTFVQAPLTIDAGVELQFAQDASLVVNQGGSLTANGTAGNEVLFHGGQDLIGYWKGIEIGTAAAANSLDHVRFSNAGSQAWFGGNNSTATLHITTDGTLTLSEAAFAKTGGYAAIVRNGGYLACTNVNHGGFMYYVYTNAGGSAQQLCPF